MTGDGRRRTEDRRLMTHSPPSMTLLDHLSELRKRVLRSILALGLVSIIGLVFSKDIYHLLQIPMIKTLPEGNSFIATTPFESYFTYFKIALLAGLFGASPVVFYQLWRFVAPALNKKEKRLLIPFSLISALLFTGGALFGYFIVFPTGFYYVNLVMEGTAIQLMPKMSDYLGFAMTLLLAFGVTFELPLVIFILGQLGVIEYKQIKQFRRYVIVCLFILAAVLTPGPDVLSQCLLALPLWVLYEVGGLSLLLSKKKERNWKLEN